MKSFLTLQVHDSIVFNLYRKEKDILPSIKKIMLTYFKNYMEFKSELDVDFKVGPNWNDMEKVKI